MDMDHMYGSQLGVCYITYKAALHADKEVKKGSNTIYRSRLG